MSKFLRLLDLSCLFLAVYCIIKIASGWRGRSRYPLPPGPKGYPIVGNLFDMPSLTSKAWKTFAEWGEKYGGICSISMFGQTFIILNDESVVQQLLDARGAIYSDRPQTTMFKLNGFSETTPFLPYNDVLREHRKVMAQGMGTARAIKKLHPSVDHYSYRLLERLLKDHSNLDQVIHRSTGSALLSMAYGYNTSEEGDELLAAVDRIVVLFNEAVIPGRFLVDVFPFLQHLPEWVPGCRGFRNFADECRICSEWMVNRPMEYVRNEMGRGPSSYASELLSDPRCQDKLDIIARTATNFYGAGTDTMKSAILNFFLAMSVYSAIQQRLHEEIDSVIGRDRLPTHQDRDVLLYLQAVFKECFRWLPAVPSGVFHVTSSDDIYEGFMVPEGSIVIANTWKLLHDPAVYKDPSSFNPERFLGPNPEKDPFSYCFGFGRRICPGILLANALVWEYLAKMAASFRISKALDSDGVEIEPVCDQMPGAVSQPVPFNCRLTPRHDQIRRLVEAGLTDGL